MATLEGAVVERGDEPEERSLGSQLVEDAGRLARTMLVAVPLGAFITGVVARLGMLLLAKLNPRTAGMLTDDGFPIDRFTLSGSLNLALAGVFLGAFSGVLYAALSPLKVGPAWFQRASLSIGAGVVVGDALIHTSGIDFVFLRPVGVTVALFIGIPILHVLVLDLLVDRVESGHVLHGRWWTVVGLALSAIVVPVTAALALARAALLWARRQDALRSIVTASAWPWLARAVLVALFVRSVWTIAQDVRFLT